METTVYHANYVRNARAIGVLWGIFTVCFAIINVVVFITPHWIGDTEDSPGTGHFGLWKACQTQVYDQMSRQVCTGELGDFGSLVNGSFKASTVFIGLSALFTLLCVLCMLLFFFLSATTVFVTCCWIQTFSAICMIIGSVIYPSGWDDEKVKAICGDDATKYGIGTCEMRWAYILAIIGIFDAVVLASLAFVLATKHVKLIPSKGALDATMGIHPAGNGSIYHGDAISVTPNHKAIYAAPFQGENGPYAQSTISKKSLNLQPVMTMPAPPPPHLVAVEQTDRYSEYSHHTTRSRKHDYASSVQDFQL